MKITESKRATFPLKGCGVRGAKKARHERKGHGESGRAKSKSCQATWLQRSVCKNARAYRRPEYSTIMLSIDKKSGDKRASLVGNEEAKIGIGKRANNLHLST